MSLSRLCLAALAAALGLFSTSGAEAKMKIGMVVWIGCEDVCRGVRDSLATNGIDADFVVMDAAQDQSRLPGFVEQARTEKMDLVLTWGTKTTLGVLGTLADRTDPKYLNEIPIVFTVVADPVGSGIIESYEKIGRDNVTGTRNRVPETVNIKSIRRYMPSFDHLGMLYEAATPNSVGKVEEVKGLTGALNFTLDAVPLDMLADGSPDPESIEPGIAALKSKGVQFIYLGSSAFLEKESDHFTGAALAAGIPVLTPYEHMVSDSQALMSVAARDYDVGKLAGEQVRRILVEGRRAGDIPVLAMEEFAYLVNMKVAKALNLYPPVEFLQFVEKVE
ncbi:ABC transporter substrate-binding protein [Sinorhizobium garamanticum]|uniref:ABC transporter substrate-binding protein n=1 Tax=Sinorhizobium garamanticum TaxID=680247 RepID=A0ABY8DLN4_9HYPH|nr:ABC transporter substrate-binding protein [Sinorhizobium garamanticum]WEX91133.1 ABC transporter substrate-binding protein [Sinorhizobium garamanticum]